MHIGAPVNCLMPQ